MLNNPPPGPGSVPEYQVSAIPWVTSSLFAAAPTGLEFPYVTQFITVKNPLGNSRMYLSFTRNGLNSSGSHYVPLDSGETFSAAVRVKSLFLSGANGQQFTVFAGLTMIQSRFLPDITGSNGYQGVG